MLRLALRGLRQHALASTLTASSVALGTALTVAVLLLARGAEGAFEKTATGVPVLVTGSKGGRIDGLLSTLFHTGRTPGRLPLSYADELERDPRTAWAYPVALGDRVHGFPLVGTRAGFLALFGVDGETFSPGARQAVAGARTGLRVGDRFEPSHLGALRHRGAEFVVTGVLRATGTAHDRAVWTSIEDFLALPGHDGAMVSAVYLKPSSNSPMVVEPLLRDIDESAHAQAIRPSQAVAELMELFGTAARVLHIVSWIVIGVAAMAVAVSLYNAMASRRREVAILRALGARRTTVVGATLLEAVLLCLAGGLGGIVLGHAGAAAFAGALERYAGAPFEPGFLLPAEPLLLAAIAALGAIAGALPAARAYGVDVATTLS